MSYIKTGWYIFSRGPLCAAFATTPNHEMQAQIIQSEFFKFNKELCKLNSVATFRLSPSCAKLPQVTTVMEFATALQSIYKADIELSANCCAEARRRFETSKEDLKWAGEIMDVKHAEFYKLNMTLLGVTTAMQEMVEVK